MRVYLAHFPSLPRGSLTSFEDLTWGLNHDRTSFPVERWGVIIRPTVSADIPHGIWSLWYRDLTTRNLDYEVLPPIAHRSITAVCGVAIVT